MNKFVHKQKTGGRRKGTPNKMTMFQRAFIQTFLNGETGKFKQEISLLHGESYIKVILLLMEYVTPKLQRIIVEDENGENKEVQRWVMLSDGTKIPLP